IDDPEGAQALLALREAGLETAARVHTGRGFLLPARLDRAEIEAACKELLADPVLDAARVTAPGRAPDRAPRIRRILVARKPGVMDPVALTVQRALATTGLAKAAREAGFFVTTFRVFEVELERPDLPRDVLAQAAARALANETIEDILVDDERLVFAEPPESPRH